METDQEYHACVKKRERLYRWLQITYDLLNGLPAKEDVFLARGDKLASHRDEFEEIQDRLVLLKFNLKDESVPIESVSTAFDELYYPILARYNTLTRAMNVNQPPANPNNCQEVRSLRPKLPPIQIPRFKGDLEKFPAFISLYDTLVHNTDLPSVQKFSVLKSYLDYPASSVLDGLELRDENYESAYKKLVERYTDQRMVGTHHFNKLMQFKPLPTATPQNLRQFLDVFCAQYEALKTVGLPNLMDFFIFSLSMRVLDGDTKRLFEEKYAHEASPTYDQLVSFVKDQFKVASILQTPAPKSSGPASSLGQPAGARGSRSTKHGNPSTKSFISNIQSSQNNTCVSTSVPPKPTIKCPMCQLGHKLMQCPDFGLLSPTQRFDKVQSLRLCFSCFGTHSRANCQSRFRCKRCNKPNHHTMLHRENESSSSLTAPSASPNSDDPPCKEATNALNCRVQTQTTLGTITTGLLGTALARIQSSTGEWIPCRLIIDPASESSFVTESLTQTLRLPRKRCSVDIVGVGSSTFSNQKGSISCTLAPIHTLNPSLEVEAIVLPSISSQLPKRPLDSVIRQKFQHLSLADPTFDEPGPIDVLLGVQHYSEILAENCGPIKGEPSAINTVFGFVILGKLPSSQGPTTSISMFTRIPSIDGLLRQFWETEEVMCSPKENPDDVACEQHFINNTTRDNQGRYQVSFPFRSDPGPDKLGSTRSIAFKRLTSLEHRLTKKPLLKEQYNANLQDYVDQNHMQLATSPGDYLLTHHAVSKESTTTQLRVVFNASEKSSTSYSLNDCLLPGPKLQTDISQLLLTFRLNPIALIADIKQMYRCIRLNRSDVKYTHLLWRKEYDQPIQEWEITTLPFGVTCGPYLAQRVVKQLVKDEGCKYPLASKYLDSCLYIDDLICSVPSVQDAIELYRELTQLFARGGFLMRKFSSNSSSVLDEIPAEHQETPISFGDESYVKLLGFYWDPVSDNFKYKVNISSINFTKRSILSQVARIYDVNGYLTPVTFWMKCFLQLLWIAGVDWDSEIPIELQQSWSKFYSQISELKTLTIPRHIPIQPSDVITLIGFCDASEKGYAACLYLRAASWDNQVRISLIRAKSRVAPLKTETIPRLELNGAVLLAKLFVSLKDFLTHLPHYEVYCFTDNKTVLSWLHSPLYTLKIYEANRVGQIIETLPPSYWRHVPGETNAADIASRGSYPAPFLENDLWWKGPNFLYQPITEWPPYVKPRPTTTAASESENTTLALCQIVNHESPLIDELLGKYSNLSKIHRILCYVFRFISNTRTPRSDRVTGVIKFGEMNQALNRIVRHTQTQYYPDVIRQTTNHQPIKGPLRHLTPFVDELGILRVGGRLRSAPIAAASRHPILLPRKSRTAELICLQCHDLTLHGGPQIMQSVIQRKYWIPGIRYLLRSISFKCLRCYKFKAKPLEPLMASVPSVRFQRARAFLHTGVDLTGPFWLKEGKRRNARSSRCWIILYICMSTRAVHLDIVSEASTVVFLASLDRFVARRGIPTKLLSDLGTNFVGAARELKEVVHSLLSENPQLQEYCEQRNIQWEFNPPASPNFGGLWEAAIRSMKHHLRRVLNDRPLTFEEWSTILARIEGILNSRPLCPLSSNPTDGWDYLTPGHFLIGAPMILSRPEEDHLGQSINLCSRWHLLTRGLQDVWKRWSQEYLHTLIHRPKWDQPERSLSPGDLVLLTDKTTPPASWNVARVIDVISGNDGIHRVAKIRTPQGYFTRPINKLAPFPFHCEAS